jgi:hypothetical protein
MLNAGLKFSVNKLRKRLRRFIWSTCGPPILRTFVRRLPSIFGKSVPAAQTKKLTTLQRDGGRRGVVLSRACSEKPERDEPRLGRQEPSCSVSSQRKQGPIASESRKATCACRLIGDTAYGSLLSQGRRGMSWPLPSLPELIALSRCSKEERRGFPRRSVRLDRFADQRSS